MKKNTVKNKNVLSAPVLILFFILCMYPGCSGHRIKVEYPLFEKNEAGYRLRRFLNGRKRLSLIIEKKNLSRWDPALSNDDVFANNIAEKIHEEFSKNGYYQMISEFNMEDIFRDQLYLSYNSRSLSESDALQNTELFLWIEISEPSAECSIEPKINTSACSRAVIMGAASAMQNNRASYVPQQQIAKPCTPVNTGVRIVKIPVRAVLFNSETGESMDYRVPEEPYVIKSYSYPGYEICPPLFEALDKNIKSVANDLNKRFSPLKKSRKLKILVNDQNPEAQKMLEEGYREIKGENPDYKKAREYWLEAIRINPESEGAIINLAALYFSVGDYEKSLELYEKALRLEHSHEKYLKRQMRIIKRAF